MVTTHVSAALKPTFMTMPGEIRNAIYRLLLTNQYTYSQEYRIRRPLYPAILGTNRQIYRESVSILHGENIWITAKVDARFWPLIPMLVNVSREDVSKIAYPVLHIDFVMPIATKEPQPYVTMIMDEMGIGRFILFLWKISTKKDTIKDFKTLSLSLTLYETPFHTNAKLQSRLVAPFGLVHGLRNLVIQGQLKPTWVKEVLNCAETGLKDVVHIRSVSQRLLDGGDKAYFAGKPRSAVGLYWYGRHYLEHILSRRMDEAENQSRPVADFSTLRELLYMMSSHCLRASLAFGNYVGIKMTANRILRSGFLPNERRAYLKLCVARAHRAMGEGEDESRMFNEALNTSGDEYAFLTALAELFPKAAPEQMKLLAKQQGRLQSGETIDLDVIRAFWEAV